jgi:hypothetical protein
LFQPDDILPVIQLAMPILFMFVGFSLYPSIVLMIAPKPTGTKWSAAIMECPGLLFFCSTTENPLKVGNDPWQRKRKEVVMRKILKCHWIQFQNLIDCDGKQQ